MDPTHYTTASGRDARIRIKPSGKDFGCFSMIRIAGKEVWRSKNYPEGCGAEAKQEAVNVLATFWG